MKPIRFCAAMALLVGAWDIGGTALALDISATIPLERYTIIDADNLQQDEGYLHENGKFEVISSFVGGYEGFTEDVFQPISGRPVMIAEEFDDYKAVGAIPHWVRSKETFPIGLTDNVIVSVVGGLDPNPIPTIQEQPTNQTVLEGQIAFFFVEASPAAYLSYQWLFDGRPIAGQNASFLIVDVEKPTQAGNYSVEMNAGGKNVVSKKAGLKIVAPVTITTQPKAQTVKTGHGAVFRVAAKGTSPYRYQWYFNNNPIPEATKSFYSIPHITETDAGSYSVVVTNQLSFAASEAAVLSVIP